MLRGGKTRVAIASLIILAILAISTVSANTHTSTADVDPDIVKGGGSYLFTATITNNGPASVSEFRVYNNTAEQNGGLEPFTNLVCNPVSGWNGPYYIPGTPTGFCQYTAKTTGDYIPPLGSKTFTFNFDTPTTDCWRKIMLETRDPDQYYTPLPIEIAVDAKDPITTKSFDGPQKIEGGVEWIDGVTKVVLTPSDPDPHPSGVKETKYRVTLLRSNDACNNPSVCQSPNTVGSGEWQTYTGPFGDIPESCHLLEFYSIDKVGNEEQVKRNCFFVDKTPPEVDKKIGEPSKDNTNEEEVGDGKVSWTTSQYYSGESSVELSVLDGTKDWAGVDIPVDIELKDISLLTFWELIKSYMPDLDPNNWPPTGWDVNVILGVDTDGDGFESDIAAWHVPNPGHNPVTLGDDTFIEMDGALGGNPTTGVWAEINAYNTAQWWTVNKAGNGFAGPNDPNCYNTLSTVITSCAPNDVRFEPTDHVKLIKLEIGGSGNWNDEIAYVDYVKLNGEVILDDITFDDRFTSVSSDTPITFTCTDPQPHPSGSEELCFKVSYDEPEEWSYITEDYCKKYEGEEAYMEGDWCCVDASPETPNDGSPFVFNFDEESFHDLEYFCRDAVDKKSETYIQYYKVLTPPIIEKNMFGSYLGDCPSGRDLDHGDCYVADNGQSGVEISIMGEDGEICPAGEVECKYELWWSTTLENCIEEFDGTHLYNDKTDQCFVEGSSFDDSKESIYFHEDSTHILNVSCTYGLGVVEDIEEFLVDSTPPVTTKTYGEPFFIENEVEWISSKTPITFSAVDPDPHPSGVKEIRYKISGPIDDTYCDGINEKKQDLKDCDDAPSVLTDSFFDIFTELSHVTIPQDSCHLIEYYSVDKLGNEEKVKKQCVFVDNTPPEPLKEVGEPKEKWDGKDSIFYPEETANCWAVNGIECWKVTLDTPITLNCVDPDPHPVKHEETCFKVEVDGEDKTKEYCSSIQGEYNKNEDGYCCGLNAPYEFKFREETEHNLKYYCVDALGNKGEKIDEEKFKVMGRLFKIPLNKKWNLISVPFNPIEKEPESVFDDVEGLKAVWTYDNELDEWQVYRPGEELTNNLDEIKTGLGYWVLEDCEEPDGSGMCESLVVGGRLYEPGPVLPPSVNLQEGWNLIGFYGQEDEEGDLIQEKEAYCTLYSLRNLNDGIVSPSKWSSLITYWEPNNPDQWEELDMCDNMEIGRGYWIGMEAEGTYKPQTVCDAGFLQDVICWFT